MNLEKISLEDTHSFNTFFLDYLHEKKELKKFYHAFPVPENFKSQADLKKKYFTSEKRKSLTQVLKEQYKDIAIKESVQKNIDSLQKDNTFTVTTGHQLNIFTGPLYFIYKIVTVINACTKLNALYPEYNFVPVYWMASEDHDFAEINNFRLFGEKHSWQTNQTGAVGRFNPKEITNIFEEWPEGSSVFKDAYQNSASLAQATRHFVNELFGSAGLIVVDGDDPVLKSAFKPVITEDLESNTPKSLIEKTTSQLEALGYKSQIHVRDINLFYLDGNIRNRIEFSNGKYNVVDTTLSFSKEELLSLVDQHPERFSPNVALRPLYQEMILPNIAYVGGPAEVIYWLQLKSAFEHFSIPFPVLMPRNFAMVVDQETLQKSKKAEVTLNDIFLPWSTLENTFTINHATHQLKLNGEKEAIEKYFEVIRKNVEAFDQSLGPLVGAEGHRAQKSLEKIEQKLLKAEKRFLSEKLARVEKLKAKLFPGGSPQERTDNFLNFYSRDPQFIQKLIENFDPFDFRFNIVTLDI